MKAETKHSMDTPGSPDTWVAPVFPEKQGLEREQTLADIPSPDVTQPSVKGPQKAIILSILCSALFFDIFNSGSTIVALPTVNIPLRLMYYYSPIYFGAQIQRDLGFSEGELQWVFTAYTLTFAAFLLSAGRLSDIYHPKPVFCIGYITVGVFSVLCGVSVHPIMLLIFRAIQGIGAWTCYPYLEHVNRHSFKGEQ
jgi:Major Facilitator Superfamily